MNERVGGFLKQQIKEMKDGIIAIRISRTPFFGVQTVFAPMIDNLIKKDLKQDDNDVAEGISSEKVRYRVKNFPL